jgi:two-component system chemotaxis sensor kinase CheA
MNPLLEQYLQEARENLKYIEQNLESLGSADNELINAIFRAVHTMKGGSGIVGFNSVRDITHKAEDLLDQLRSGNMEFEDRMLEVLYDAFDEVFNLIEAAEETGDVVEGDLEARDRIIEELVDILGSNGEKAWELPFNFMEDKQVLNKISKINLDSLEDTLPFEYEALTEENLENKRLYAVFFDVPENCMCFGNDPIYALSLLEDSLVSLDMYMPKNVASSVLEGTEDPDGLILKTQITAFIYAQYEDIEDSIYNFVDDSYILPFDIKNMLSVSLGSFENIDFLKDFVSNAKELIESHKIDDLKSSIVETLGMINKDSAQAHMLERFLLSLKFIKDEDLNKYFEFLDSLVSNKFYNCENIEDCEEVSSSSTPVVASSSSSNINDSEDIEVDVSKLNLDFTEDERNVILDMVKQQQFQLENVDTEDILFQVTRTLEKCAIFLQLDFDTSYSKEDMIQWCKGAISGTLEQKEVSQAPATEPVSVKEESKPEPTPVKVESKPEPAVVKEEPKPTPAPAKVEPKVEVKKEVAKVEEKKEVKPAAKKPAPAPAKKAEQAKKSDVVGKVIKIDQSSIDYLMSIAGELLVAKNSLPYLADSVPSMDEDMIKRAILEKYSFINRLSTQLQDLIIGMRMLPISYVFDRYPKLVREISRKLGKKVKLIQEGAETRLDKSIIEMLADPLIHIVRNSLDHGLEGPEERVENGKDESGTVTMHAYPESDKVVIKIMDDGRGINTDRVVQKVLENDLIPLEKIEAMSEDEKAELVMLAGLSTAEEISEFSGRGVGMDVVKKSIESFGGSINIKTTQGTGTTITLSIPVSLAITTLLSVSMNKLNYGFPMDIVNETVKIRSNEITYLNGDPFIYIRGQVVPLLIIEEMVDYDLTQDVQLSIVIINVKGNQLAVVVNDFLGQLDVVQKPLEGMLENHPLFSAAALLGNGKIIMIMDPIGLLELQHNRKKDKSA